jgi:hypothetical protein
MITDPTHFESFSNSDMEGAAMNTDVEKFEVKALRWIDKLAEGARAIVMIASPIMEEIIAAATAAKGSYGKSARSTDQRAKNTTGDDNEATKPGLWRNEVAALFIIGAIGCGGVYSLRRWVLQK